MNKLKRELKNCLWGSLLLLAALTILLLMNSGELLSAYDRDSKHTAVISVEKINK